MRRLRLLTVACVLVTFVAPASATVLLARSLEELVARADRVDVGVVTARRSLDEGELGVIETRVRVEQTLKGAPVAELVLSQLGGEQDGVATELVGDARLAVGERWLLVTFAAPDGRRWLVSMGMGAFRVDGERARQEVDAALARPDGTVQPGPLVRTFGLDDVRRAVRAGGTP